MSNLRLIAETSGTNVTSVSLTDVFTSDYDVYRIEQTNYTPLSASSQSVMRLILSNGIEVQDRYDYYSFYAPSFSSFVDDKSSENTYMMDGLYNDQNDVLGGGAVYHLFHPTSASYYTFGIGESTQFNTGSGYFARRQFGVLEEQASVTGVTFLSTGSANITTNIRVFGIRRD